MRWRQQTLHNHLEAGFWLDDITPPEDNEYGIGLTYLENRLSHFTAFYYSVIDQHFEVEAAKGDSTVSEWWAPLNATLTGTAHVPSARLRVNGAQLITGCIGVLALVVFSMISVGRPRPYDGVIRDGGVIDMISLLYGSSLPASICGKDGLNFSELERRQQAEKVEVM